jgi:hypothetical protein
VAALQAALDLAVPCVHGNADEISWTRSMRVRMYVELSRWSYLM